ncbi:ankyrin repeat-containing domain protein [Xylaria telfairii]|nr:ankyrin repeat-containing domain protein [Xylaria telfairii]
MMKFIYSKMKQNSDTISFFFNARGGYLEKSTQGMYRSLLFQLLEKLPHSQKEQLFGHYPFFNGAKKGSMKWDNAILQDLFSKAISQFSQRELICFVDALDECHESDVYEMVEYFENLGRLASEANVTLLICLSSRHYPSIPVKDGLTLTLENQAGHGWDLKEYVKHRLDPGLKNASVIRDKLLRKAAGVFMWVVLVVNILNKEYQRGRIFAVTKRLDEIPSKLSELFKDLLKRDNENMSEFLLSIQWILFARRPLHPAEYYYALLSGLDHDPSDLGEWTNVEVTIENMKQYVLTSSKGLAEVTRLPYSTRRIARETPRDSVINATTSAIHKSLRVQFIHESVQDFLLKDGGIIEIWPDLQPDFPSYSHNILKKCCYAYIEARKLDIQTEDVPPEVLIRHGFENPDKFRNWATRLHNQGGLQNRGEPEDSEELEDWGLVGFGLNPPFAGYALQNVAYHSIHAAASFSQHCFLESFDFGTWARLYNKYSKPSLKGWELCEALVYLLTSQSPVGCCETGILSDSPIADRPAVWPKLLQQTEPLPPSLKYLLFHGFTPPRLAIEECHEDLLQRLLERGADIDEKDEMSYTLLVHAIRSGRTPLAWATSCGTTRIVRSLLDKGGVANVVDKNGATPLHFATKRGQTTMVELLLARGGNTNAADNNGETPLHLAIEQRYMEIVRLLLEHSAQVNAADNNGRTPLHIAAEWTYRAAHPDAIFGLDATYLYKKTFQEPEIELFQLLDEYGAQINTLNNKSSTSLHREIAKMANIPLVALLLNDGAQVNTADNKNLTSLHREAAERVAIPLVAMLLDHWKSNKEGSTHRYMAVSKDANIKAVQLLLDHGAQVNAANNKKSTPLHAAAAKRVNIPIVALLLNRGALVNATDNEGLTPLHMAAFESFNSEMVRLLLDHGAQVNVTDNEGLTPLHIAACKTLNGGILQLLLDHGAKVNVADINGVTPLQLAVKYSSVEIREILESRSQSSQA